ncbi:unnamed protein product, partial [marine sediment metagenome]
LITTIRHLLDISQLFNIVSISNLIFEKNDIKIKIIF